MQLPAMGKVGLKKVLQNRPGARTSPPGMTGIP